MMAATKAKAANGSLKTDCPVTKEQFLAHAKPLVLTLPDGRQLLLGVKEFSTGSFGWFGNEKVVIQIGDTPVKVQANVGFTVVGSKGTGG